MTEPLLLIAASGLARETIEACRRTGDTEKVGWSGPLLGLLDDDRSKHGTTVDEIPVLGGIDTIGDHPEAQLVICAGKGSSRRSIAARLAGLGVIESRYATVVDPSVVLPRTCTIGAGTILLAGTVLTANVTVGRHVVCMPNVILTHDDVLEDFATLAAGVALGGGVTVGEAAYLGMNSSVRESHRVGADAVLGMGSALIADQPAATVWAGVPARELSKAKES